MMNIVTALLGWVLISITVLMINNTEYGMAIGAAMMWVQMMILSGREVKHGR
jgi:hypothetical protein